MDTSFQKNFLLLRKAADIIETQIETLTLELIQMDDIIEQLEKRNNK
jgi:hypothetical protein